MQIKVRNILGVSRADLAIEPGQIVLVAAGNRQGKSSLIDVIRMLVTGDLEARGTSKKKDLSALVRFGETGGKALFDDGKGAVREISFPSGDVQTHGNPAAGDPLACGAVLFSQMTPGARIKALREMLGGWPTPDELEAALVEVQGEKRGKESAGSIGQKLREQGWDPTWEASKEFGAKLKGQWRQVTGEQWGARKAENWRPEGFDAIDGPADIEAAQRLVKEAEAEVVENRASNIATEREIETMKATAARRGEIETSIETVAESIDRAMKDVEAAVKARAALPVAVDVTGMPKCPHCEKPIHVKQPNPHVIELTAPAVERALTKEELGERRMAIARADGQIQNKEGVLSTLRRNRLDLDSELTGVKEAERRLKALADRDMDGGDQDAAAAAAKRLEKAKADLRHLEQVDQAAAIHRKIQINVATTAVLAPEGLRQKCMGEVLERFNGALAELSEIIGQTARSVPAAVDIGLDGEVTVAALPLNLLSESERWSVDVVAMAAAARFKRPPICVVDRLDVAVGTFRNKALDLFKASGMTVVAAMAINPKRADRVPDFAKMPPGAPWGNTYWMADGQVMPLSEVTRE